MLFIHSIAQIKSFSKHVKNYFKIILRKFMSGREIKLKKANFSFFHDFDLDGFPFGVFTQGQNFHQKSLSIFESLFFLL